MGISQYDNLSDFQYARFHILVVHLHTGLFWLRGIPHGEDTGLIVNLVVSPAGKNKSMNILCSHMGDFIESRIPRTYSIGFPRI